MATSKSGGSTSNGRESHSQRLGCKRFDGQLVKAGEIIFRQRGTKIHPGKGVRIATDDTIYTVIHGVVKFHKGFKGRTFVSVLPTQQS